METMGKIYLATSDKSLLKALRGVLKPAGYRLQEPMDWNLVSEEVGFFGADVVLLGASTKNRDPETILRRLNEGRDTNAAVVVLCDEYDPTEVGLWLDAGADDVLGGELVPQQLLSRIAMHVQIRNQAKAGETLPDLLYLGPTADDDESSAPSRPKGIPEHLPKGLDAFYESDLAWSSRSPRRSRARCRWRTRSTSSSDASRTRSP